MRFALIREHSRMRAHCDWKPEKLFGRASILKVVALFECPDCGGKVSTEAPACPHCGRPAPSPHSVPERPGQTGRSRGKGRKKKASPKGVLVLIGVFTLLYLLIVNSGDPGSEQRRTSTVNRLSPAETLAVGDGRGKNDPDIAAAFSRLDAACPEDGEALADIAVNFKRLASENGHHFSLIEGMNHLSGIQESTGRAVSCADTAALSLTLLTR